VEAPVVVLVLPADELLGQLLGTLELRPPIELVGVGSMTALDLSVALGTTPRDPAVQNADILEVPGEVGAELGPVSTMCRGSPSSGIAPALGAGVTSGSQANR
jgi:hypothetical protein